MEFLQYHHGNTGNTGLISPLNKLEREVVKEGIKGLDKERDRGGGEAEAGEEERGKGGE